MSEMLMRAQFWAMCNDQQYGDAQREHRERVWQQIEMERSAIRQQLAQVTAEVQHYREACASVGETDGHGWAETTKELKRQIAERKAELTQRKADGR